MIAGHLLAACVECGTNGVWLKQVIHLGEREENHEKDEFDDVEKDDGLNNEKVKRNGQSMVLEMKIDEIVVQRRKFSKGPD
ncbi:hypothetical protein Tco_1466315 [Tanacetum coccineum]